jgi:mannonate dehydratase
MIRLAEMLRPDPDILWDYCQQLGVTHVVTVLPRAPEGGSAWSRDALAQAQQRFADAGFTVSVIESSPPMDKIRMGLPGRDEQIEHVCEMLTNMGELGIPVWCYNFMAVLNWLRTGLDIPARGGAKVTGYDHRQMQDAPLTEAGEVSEEQLWEGFAYFLKYVVPVAEKAGVKMALHPDDPPLSPIRGLSRIFRNVEAFQRAIDMVPSEVNGITFCQGCFSEMGLDVPATIRHFGDQNKIHFIHFRDVRGTADNFVETFHDDGQTNMLQAMRCYAQIGFDGPMRPDHVPTMAGESNDTPGYTRLGRLFAIGYIKGLMAAAYEDSSAKRG